MPYQSLPSDPPNPDYKAWFEMYATSPLVLEQPLKGRAPNRVIAHIKIPTRFYVSGQLGGTGNGIPATRKDPT